MVPPVEFTSYYGRNVVKPPPWEWPVALYLFVGGVAGGSGVLAAGAQLAGLPTLRRNARLGAMAAVTVSGGALVADRTGQATAHAMTNLQERGVMFLQPQTPVYEGMIIGENSRESDMNVNITKEKQLTNMRSSTSEIATKIIPPQIPTLERALEWINDDELVEATPTAIRLRKKILSSNRK